MCGITGFLSVPRHDAAAAPEALQRMTDAMQRRGPDSAGYWHSADGIVGLGHRRLAILDLSPTGHQPMLSHDGRWVMVFNGEIYNYRVLRDELSRAGVRFNGTSDTEVLIYAIDHWGLTKALRRLDGMFAFALWDQRERCLHLARDRIGEKPLYYTAGGEGFLFGSELKALRAHPGFKPAIDRHALALYLGLGHVPGAHCIYEGVRKLRPGHSLTVRPGTMCPEPAAYWQAGELLEARDTDRRSPDDPALIDQVEATLRRAVRDRMVSDVPLGALLSGGIDSSLIVSLMQAESTRPVQTFTVGYEGSPADESGDAARVARHLGTEHHACQVTGAETLAVVGRIPEIYDEPFADSSQIPTHLVSLFARRHVTVALSGDAGDELFAGYDRYLWSARVWPRLERTPRVVRRGGRRVIQACAPGTWTKFFNAANRVVPSRWRVRGGGEKLHKLAHFLEAGSPEELYEGLISAWPDPASLLRDPPAGAGRLVLPELPGDMPFVQRMMFYDLIGCLPDDMLCKVDRAAMAASLEMRVPFLANEVVDLAWRLPVATHTHRGTGKWLLRQVLARHVPKTLFDRPKTGFGVPIRDWLRGPLKEWAGDLLAEDRLKRDGYFKPGPIQEAWRDHQSGKCSNQKRLWTVLMFQAWLAANR